MPKTVHILIDHHMEFFHMYKCTLFILPGTLSDPVELPGLAHFCEHMSFLGSEKVSSKQGFAFLIQPSLARHLGMYCVSLFWRHNVEKYMSKHGIEQLITTNFDFRYLVLIIRGKVVTAYITGKTRHLSAVEPYINP